MLAKIGPLRNVKERDPVCDSSITVVPRMSAGIMSGVNWMRENTSCSASAMVRTSRVLPSPGTPSSSACEPASMHTITPSTTSWWPTITLPTSWRSAAARRWNSATVSRALSLSCSVILVLGFGAPLRGEHAWCRR